MAIAKSALLPTTTTPIQASPMDEAMSKPKQLAGLDASRLTVTLTDSPKPLPALETIRFGQTMTDHMLIITHDPTNGWSAPEIRPYAPLSVDPAASCFQYCPNVFEGMKAYMGPDGKPRLFRPAQNMERFKRSAERVALPAFDGQALLTLIKRLILIESRWVPQGSGYSLYIRPTFIGTRPCLGPVPSDHAILYVILTPTGPYFSRAVSLLAVGECVRAWPGGTGSYKLGLNYAPGFLPQKMAAKKDYDQILWLLGDAVTEAGAMNFFVVIRREDDDLDVITPPLDGTILPGLTRSSVLSLAAAHSFRTVLPNISSTQRLYPHERTITIHDLAMWCAEGKLQEAFCVGTAVVVAPVRRIGWQGQDLFLPDYDGGMGPVARALRERIVDIQEGRVEWDGWSVTCQ